MSTPPPPPPQPSTQPSEEESTHSWNQHATKCHLRTQRAQPVCSFLLLLASVLLTAVSSWEVMLPFLFILPLTERLVSFVVLPCWARHRCCCRLPCRCGRSSKSSKRRARARSRDVHEEYKNARVLLSHPSCQMVKETWTSMLNKTMMGSTIAVAKAVSRCLWYHVELIGLVLVLCTSQELSELQLVAASLVLAREIFCSLALWTNAWITPHFLVVESVDPKQPLQIDVKNIEFWEEFGDASILILLPHFHIFEVWHWHFEKRYKQFWVREPCSLTGIILLVLLLVDRGIDVLGSVALIVGLATGIELSLCVGLFVLCFARSTTFVVIIHFAIFWEGKFDRASRFEHLFTHATIYFCVALLVGWPVLAMLLDPVLVHAAVLALVGTIFLALIIRIALRAGSCSCSDIASSVGSKESCQSAFLCWTVVSCVGAIVSMALVLFAWSSSSNIATWTNATANATSLITVNLTKNALENATTTLILRTLTTGEEMLLAPWFATTLCIFFVTLCALPVGVGCVKGQLDKRACKCLAACPTMCRVCVGKCAPKDVREKLCVACMDMPVNSINVPCGHAALCVECAKKQEGKCPLCRAEVTSTHHMYYSGV